MERNGPRARRVGSREHHMLCSERYNLAPLGLLFQVILVTVSDASLYPSPPGAGYQFVEGW